MTTMPLLVLVCLIICCGCWPTCAESGGGALFDPIKEATARAERLEKKKKVCDYRIKNLGKKYTEIDMKEIGEGLGDYAEVGVVTPALVGSCFSSIDPELAGEYYYKDWKVWWECDQQRRRGQLKVSMRECWPAPEGEYIPFNEAMWIWEQAGQYQRMVDHYQEYHDEYFKVDVGTKSAMMSLEARIYYDPELEKDHDEFMAKWGHIKELAKTEKPKPLDPAVQNHRWFYSEKQEEVQKALEYYYTYKVRFMLEKAKKHKDPVIQKKAREYLNRLGKNKNEGSK